MSSTGYRLLSCLSRFLGDHVRVRADIASELTVSSFVTS
jgi:hypothetical protein